MKWKAKDKYLVEEETPTSIEVYKLNEKKLFQLRKVSTPVLKSLQSLPSVCLFHYHTKHFTSAHQTCGGFPPHHQAIFRHQHSTQFWPTYPETAWFHRIRAPSHKTALPSHIHFWHQSQALTNQLLIIGSSDPLLELQIPFPSPSCYLYFWPTCYKPEGPSTPSQV